MHLFQKAISLLCTTGFYFALFMAPACAMTPADKEMYEKLGLSETEWAMILDAKMPLSKVKELLRDGISITEYFKQPWKELNISESQWISKRRNGYTDSDMRSMKQPKGTAGEWTTITAFFLPGFYQLKRDQKFKGWCMAGIAIASVGLFAFQTADSKRIQPLGLILLIPDMLWSGVDMGIQVNREQNPDASRFTKNSSSISDFGLSLQFPLP